MDYSFDMIFVVLFLYAMVYSNESISSHTAGQDIDDFIQLLDVPDTALNGETHGGSYLLVPGVSIFDCDNDGFEDIFYASQENEYHKLFINNGNFSFTEQAIDRGINTTLGASGVVAFDMDNNGDIDLALSYVGPYNQKGLQFYYNTGDCQFEDRTDSILQGIPELYTGGGLSVSDYDHDGDLDLFAIGFGSLIRELPHSVSGINMIYRNELDIETGEFSFVKLPRSDPPIPTYSEWGCVSGWEDIDEDGWDDVVFGICGDPFGAGDATYLWRNNYAEAQVEDFQDVSDEYGMGQCNDLQRGPQFPMSISFGHLDSDNHFDLFTTNAGTPALPVIYRAIWERDEFMGYEVVEVEGLNEYHFNWGANVVDLDNDGKDDLVTVGTFLSLGFRENPGYVYRNQVSRKEYKFEETQALGLSNYSTSVVANADFDHDGYRDIVVNTVCEALFDDCLEEVPLKIYRNNGGDLNLENRHWLEIGLKGDGIGTNYYGVGSLIRVKIMGYRYDKTGKIRVGTDGGNTNSIFAHFGIVHRNKRGGMGKGGRYDGDDDDDEVLADVCVEWMGQDMNKECWKDIQLNQRIILQQYTGIKVE